MYEGFSDRFNGYLDRFNLPKGRKRAGALSKLLDITPFTSRRMVYENLPPRDTTLVKLIQTLEPDADIRNTVSFLRFGLPRNQGKSDFQLIDQVVKEVRKQADIIKLDLTSAPKEIIENIWVKLFNEAKSNNGLVNSKKAESLLLNLQELL